MRETGDYCGESVKSAIDVIRGKWSLPILWELHQQERRYADLQRQLGGISQKVLSHELRRLTRAGLVDREVAHTVPPQVTYRITADGRSAQAVIEQLARWGDRRGA